MDRRLRRDIIRGLIESDPPASQRELVARLIERGVDADQSTVSRDLKEMGVYRMPGPHGGAIYGFPGKWGIPSNRDEYRRALKEYVISIEASGNMIVLRTAPGNAQAMAAILDRARLKEVAGTVAGDDTILVVVREGFKAKDLEAGFREIAG